LCQNAGAAGSRGRGAGTDSERHFVFPTTALPGLRLVTVKGPDRVRFLQSQLTQDVALAAAGTTCLAGWADPRGRLLWAGHLGLLPDVDGDCFGLVVPAGIAEALVARLRLYVLRAKVTVALAGDPERALRVGPAGSGPVAGDAAAWELADIRAGLPTVEAATSGEFVPQMVNLDLLGGISFTKGCYPGQEIVARMHYRGKPKRRGFAARLAGDPDSAPAPGTDLLAEGANEPAGAVVASAPAPGGGLVVLHEAVIDAALRGLLRTPDGRALQALPLPYPLPSDFGGKGAGASGAATGAADGTAAPTAAGRQ
jgi:folate-binding protein YgfZ